jgi:hypothetical protein
LILNVEKIFVHVMFHLSLEPIIGLGLQKKEQNNERESLFYQPG